MASNTNNFLQKWIANFEKCFCSDQTINYPKDYIVFFSTLDPKISAIEAKAKATQAKVEAKLKKNVTQNVDVVSFSKAGKED